jgi:ABC-2 type transport system ATP-binding protein
MPAAAAVADAVVHIEHLTHSYDQRTALSDLSLSVARAEIFGFLGPNGSGKTTLFRILSTLLPVTQGRVSMLGFDLATQRQQIRRQIGVVFQSPSLDKQLTAEENLRHQGHLYGLTGAELERRIDEMLGRVGLEKRPSEYVGTFSGGMRRRVELAKGLLHRPRVLLLDEPSTGLDPGARIDLWRYLRQIRDQDGVTILVTTHLMDEAEHCSRLAIMDIGRLVACDTPAALKDQIGGDVITLVPGEGEDAEAMRSAIRQRVGAESVVVERALRIERDRGHEFIPKLVEAFPGAIRSVSLGKPTLEDVFVHVTGHGFGGNAEF